MLFQITAALVQITENYKAIVEKIIRNYGTFITYKLRLEIIANYIKILYGSSNFPQIIDDYYKLR